MSAPDCRDLALGAGLVTAAAAGRKNARGRCPECDSSDGGSFAAEVWRCFACPARGNARTLAIRLGDVAAVDAADRARAEKARRMAASAPPAARIDVDRAFAALRRYEPSEDRERRRRYLVETRGWSDEIAAAVLDSATWTYASAAAVDEAGRQLGRDSLEAIAGRELLKECRGRNRLIFALRDDDGRVVDCKRRFEGQTRDRRRKSPQLSGERRASPDAPTTLGRLGLGPAVRRVVERGGVLHIVEGDPDVLSIEALVKLRGDYDADAVVGASGWPQILKIAKRTRAMIPLHAVPEIVLWPHIGDKADVGERACVEAADILEDVAAVRVVRVVDDGKSDVEDVLRRRPDDALDYLADLLDAADYRPRPVVLGPDGRAIRDQITTAAAAALADRRKVPMVVIPPGAGKTREGLAVAAEYASRGHVVAYAVPAHDPHASAAAASLAERFPDVAVDVAVGAMRECHYRDQARPIYRHAKRRRLCGIGWSGQECEHAAAGCPGALAARPAPGRVLICTHHMVPHLSLPPDAVLFIDEAPPFLDVVPLGRDALASLPNPNPRSLPSADWQNQNRETTEIAAVLVDALDAAAADNAARCAARPLQPPRQHYDTTLTVADLLDLVPELKELGDLDPERGPPLPPPAVNRAGGWRDYPDPSAWAALCAIADDIAEDRGRIMVRLHPAGGWTLEHRQPWQLPAEAAVVALDATGKQAAREWKATTGRAVELHELKVKPVRPPAVHVETEAAKRAALVVPRTDGYLYASAPPFLRRCIDRAMKAGRDHRKRPVRSLGILTHRPVARAVLGDGPPFSHEARRLAAIRREYEAGGVEIIVGWYGCHDRGDNRFESVDALVLVGDPRPDFAAVEADARLCGIDAADLYRDRTEATATQAIHRARHLRRGDDPPVLVYVGATPPPGVDWQTERIERGPAPPVSREAARARLDAYCDEMRGIHESVIDLDGCGRDLTRRLVAEAAERKGWSRHYVGRPGGRGRVRVWAATADDAAAYLAAVELPADFAETEASESEAITGTCASSDGASDECGRQSRDLATTRAVECPPAAVLAHAASLYDPDLLTAAITVEFDAWWTAEDIADRRKRWPYLPPDLAAIGVGVGIVTRHDALSVVVRAVCPRWPGGPLVRIPDARVFLRGRPAPSRWSEFPVMLNPETGMLTWIDLPPTHEWELPATLAVFAESAA